MKISFFLCLTIILLSAQISHAQQSIVDSLKTQLSTEQTDTGRVKIMGNLSWALYRLGEVEEAKQVAEAIIKAADQSKHVQEEFWIKRKGWGLGMLGIAETSQGKYRQSFDHHLQALELRKSIADTAGIKSSLTNLGIVCYYLAEYPKAMEYYFESLRIAELLKDTNGIAILYNNIGGVHEYQEEFEEAIKNYQIALTYRLALKDNRGMASAYNNIGNIQDYQGKHVESLENHFKALKLFTALEDKQGMANNNDNIANTYSHMGDFEKEKFYRNMAIKQYQEMDDQLGILGCLHSTAESLIKQKKYESAFESYSTGLRLAKEIGARDRIMDAYAGLAIVSAHLNQFENAYVYDTLYTLMKDSLMNTESQQKIADMKEKYESEKKDNQISLLNKNAELADETHKRKALLRNILIVAGVLLVIILFARYRFLHSLQVERMRNRISQDLHDDIGSTLSSISISSSAASMMKADNYAEMHDTLQHIGQHARSAMENMSDIVWAINPAHDTFKDMMDRLKIFSYKLLDARNIKFNMDIPETLNNIRLSIEQRKNIYLILREAIHNIAKYSQAEECLVSAYATQKRIYLTVKDNGVGFEGTTASLGGNGLLNMKHRAEALHGSFEINSELNKGTTLLIQFAYSWV